MATMFGYPSNKVNAVQVALVLSKMGDSFLGLQGVLYGVLSLERSNECSKKMYEIRKWLNELAEEVVIKNEVDEEEQFKICVELDKAGLA